MEPPLKSRFPGLACHLLQFARSGGPLFAPNRSAPLIVNRQSRRNGDNLRAVRQILLRAQRRSGTGYAMFSRFPAPGPVCARRKPRARALPLAWARLSLGLAFVVPARHRRGRRFPTASGFGRFPPFAGERKTLTNP